MSLKKWVNVAVGLSVIATVTGSALARADIAVSMGEQKAWPKEDRTKGRLLRFLFDQGAGDPGHVVLFVSDLCNDGSYFKLRLCTEKDTQQGVYISFIANLSEEHSWIAVPPSVYLFGVRDIANRPLIATSFNQDLYQSRDDKRPAALISDSLATRGGARGSSLDMARHEFLGDVKTNPNGDGDPGTSDKVNLFVSSERDVYNIWLKGDTREEAQKLLDLFATTANLIKAPASDPAEKVQGKFGWWTNCAFTVNRWMVAMLGEDYRVMPPLIAEANIENPRHYARVLLDKIQKVKDKGNFPFETYMEYIPKVTSDRPASSGFGSPAENLYDPRHIAGIALWHSFPEVAGFELLMNIPNLRFKMDKEYDKAASPEISKLEDQLRDAHKSHASGDSIKKLEGDLKTAQGDWLGTSDDWKSAAQQRQAAFTKAQALPNLPAELKQMLTEKADKPGSFAKEVTTILSYRSNTLLDSRDGDSHVLQFAFKAIDGDNKGKDEGQLLQTSLSATGLATSPTSLSLMLSLAVVDDYLGQSGKNRPSWGEMQGYLALMNQVLDKVSAN